MLLDKAAIRQCVGAKAGAAPGEAGQPLNALFEGVDGAVTHAILHPNDSLAGIQADLDA